MVLVVGGNAVGKLTQLDARHIPQSHHGAVLVGTQDDVLEFLHIFQSPFQLQGILGAQLAVERRCADLASGNLHILFAQGIGNVVRSNAQCGHLWRVHPQTHGIVGGTEHAHIGHAFYPLERVLHIEQAVVGDEQFIQRAVRGIQIDGEENVRGALVDGQALGADFCR